MLYPILLTGTYFPVGGESLEELDKNNKHEQLHKRQIR